MKFRVESYPIVTEYKAKDLLLMEIRAKTKQHKIPLRKPKCQLLPVNYIFKQQFLRVRFAIFKEMKLNHVLCVGKAIIVLLAFFHEF